MCRKYMVFSTLYLQIVQTATAYSYIQTLDSQLASYVITIMTIVVYE